MIASEEQHKARAEAEDAPTVGTPAHAEKLRCCGIRIDFLLGLTFALNMWDWKTADVVSDNGGNGFARLAHHALCSDGMVVEVDVQF